MNQAWHRLARLSACAFAVAVFATAAHAQKAKEAWEYLQEPAFKSAYLKALGAKAKTPWLAKRDGPAPQDKFVRVAGDRYVMNAFCKNHDCNDHSAVVLYSPDRKVVYGTVHEKGRATLIGDPPPSVATELGKLWKIEWRSQPK
ncbi:MAG: Ivy family c-type lysozyme inhibitor [Betaproteobacteria bacterium]